jgi:dephospho-CoA kinase
MTARRTGHLKRIAVTGGIGSGKSTLIRELSSFGYAVYDADRLVSDVVADPQIQQKIVSCLGTDAYSTDSNGQLIYQRQWVRDRIFNDASARQELESIIHPALSARFDRICKELDLLAGGIWIFYEAALIFESRREQDFDAVVSVVAPEKLRRQRLSSSRKLSETTMAAIFSAQVSDEVRRSKSHFVIENTLDTAHLKLQAMELIEQLRNFFHPQSH